jgi:hypothetical protein
MYVKLNGSPQVDHIAVELHVHLIEMPAPVSKPPHAADPLATNVACKQRAEPAPSQPHRLVAYVDAALEQQILNIAQG